MESGTCSCPHATIRDPKGGCKHYRAAREFALTLVRARLEQLPASALRTALSTRDDLRPEIREIAEQVLWEKGRELCARIAAEVANRTYLRV